MSQDEDGRVKVNTRFKEGLLGFLQFQSPCDVDYEVQMPAECVAKISGVSCSLDANGLQGNLKFKTVSGDQQLEALSGEIDASTVSGDLEGRQIEGTLKLKSVSGKMSIQDIAAASVDAGTVSGNIKLKGDLDGGPFNMKSVSGNIAIELPEGASCRAELRTVSGVLSAGETARKSKTPGLQTVVLGEGGPAITANSVSGNLTIRGAGNSALAEPAAANEPERKTSEDRRKVLERISNGEITVDEGVSLLNGN
jgi:DUF4097 and DUF4098 domain-containing protein YvlB